MNTIFITLAIITVVIVIVIQYTNIIKLTRKVNECKEARVLAEVQKQDILRISKSLCKSLLDEDGMIPVDRLPFAILDSTINTNTDKLDSIRFRLKDGKVLTYINGIINPSNGIARLHDITYLNEKHLELIYTFIHEIKELNGKELLTIPLTPQKIKNILTYNNNTTKK